MHTTNIHVSIRIVALLSVMALLVDCRATSTDSPPVSGSAENVTRTAPSDDALFGLENEIDWFTEDAEGAGLHFEHFNGMSGDFFFPEIIGPGVGLLDIDNDEDLDVYLAQGQMLGTGKMLSDALFPPSESLPLTGRLYRNDLVVQADGTRTLRFTDVIKSPGRTPPACAAPPGAALPGL